MNKIFYICSITVFMFFSTSSNSYAYKYERSCLKDNVKEYLNISAFCQSIDNKFNFKNEPFKDLKVMSLNKQTTKKKKKSKDKGRTEIVTFEANPTKILKTKETKNISISSSKTFVKGFQLSTTNFASSLYGMQFGLINGTNDVTGAQLGFLNYTKSLTGLQVGIVNFAKQLSGIQIGLINITESVFSVEGVAIYKNSSFVNISF